MEFQEAKNWIIERATKLEACYSEKQRVIDSSSFEEICQVIKDNVGWVSENRLFSETKIGDVIPMEKLVASGIISGTENTGLCNSGDWNSGNRNSGDWNSGNRNSGNRNSGNSNSGDWNSGNRNLGLFNRDTPKLRIFEMESDWSILDWQNSSACYVSRKMILTQWITESKMTDQEKIDHPEFHTHGGYLKRYQFKEACLNWWSVLSREEKDSFKELPNWNQEIFEEITGVKFLE
jgi:hypothetical protein